MTKGRGARGVYCRTAIAADVVFERVPVLLIPKSQVFGDTREAQNAARISWYVFAWNVPTKREYVALALGYGSIYNHSFTPNAVYRCVAPDAIEYRSLRAIEPGEEITINYNGAARRHDADAFLTHVATRVFVGIRRRRRYDRGPSTAGIAGRCIASQPPEANLRTRRCR